MEKAIDFCFRTAGVAGSVTPTRQKTNAFLCEGVRRNALRVQRPTSPHLEDKRKHRMARPLRSRSRMAILICGGERRVSFYIGRTANGVIVRPKSEGNGCTYDLAERYRLMQSICRTRHDRLLYPTLHIKA